MRRLGVVIVSVMVLVACSGDDSAELDARIGELEQDVDGVTGERDAASARLAEVEGQLATARSDIEQRDSRIATLEGERDAAVTAEGEAAGERDQALADLAEAREEATAALEAQADAEAAVDELLLRFDPEIQAAISLVQASAADLVCRAGDEAGFAGDPRPRTDLVVESLLGGLPEIARKGSPSDFLDFVALDAQMTFCYEAARDRFVMEGPHGDGFYTVGLEIAPGRWRSDGQGDSCYWQISPDGNPDDIISNHFGLAGGTVTLRAGQEFQTDRCGTWTKVG